MRSLRLNAIQAVAAVSLGLIATLLAQPRLASTTALPPPHLGYGLNVRANLDMAEGLGFEWIKLYEDNFPSPKVFPPAASHYHSLYRIRAEGQPVSLDQYLEHVRQLALDGRGKVRAYEIGNELNLWMFV